MAIRREVGAEHAGEPGVVEGVDSWSGKPAFYRVSHEGLVLWVGEHNWRDDSDFYAVVWDPEKGESREVEYGTTRFPSYGNSAEPDASSEVWAAYRAWVASLEAAREARRIRPGKLLRVVKGRKVPIGLVGECIWYGAGKKFGPGPVPYRVGIKDAEGGVHWTAASNVEVVLSEGEPSRKAA